MFLSFDVNQLRGACPMSIRFITAVSAVAFMLASPLAAHAEERDSPGVVGGPERNDGDVDHARRGGDADRGPSGSSLPYEHRAAPDDNRAKDRDERDRGADRHDGADQENRPSSHPDELPGREK
jgi:hypothetical protein